MPKGNEVREGGCGDIEKGPYRGIRALKKLGGYEEMRGTARLWE